MQAINILQINVDRRRAAQDLLAHMGLTLNADMLIVCEPNKKTVAKSTWFRDQRDDVCIIKKNPKLKVTKWGRGPGFVWICIGDVHIYAVYISPNAAEGTYAAFLDSLGQDMRQRGQKILIGGDFNAKSPMWGAPLEDRRGVIMTEWISSLDLSVLNNGGKPTFVRGESESHIDLTLATAGLFPSILDWKVIDEDSLSLHKYITYSMQITHVFQHTKWRRAGLNKNKFIQAVRDDPILGNAAAEPDVFMTALKNANKRATMWVKTDSTGNTVYWWTPELEAQKAEMTAARRLLTRRRKARSRNEMEVEAALAEYKNLRSAFKKMILKAKELKWRNLCNDLEQNVWGGAYRIIVNSLKPKVPALDLDEEGIHACINALFPVATDRTWVNVPGIDGREITREELIAAANRLKSGKAPGPDGVYPEAIKILVNTHQEAVLSLLNKLYMAGHFPEDWKSAKVVLIRKPGKLTNNPGDYRPICLVDCMGKLYEAIITSRLQDSIGAGAGFSDSQYGFRKSRSTIAAIKKVMQHIEGIGANRWGALILFDIKNAFNSADWELILEALGLKTGEGHLIHIVSEYLNNRELSFGRQGKRSVNVGVPQGSVLGPTLWNVLFDGILQMETARETHFVAYADDLAVVTSCETKRGLVNKVNYIMRKVDRKVTELRLQLALEKTEVVVFSGMKKHTDINFEVRGRVFPPKSEVKYLGVIIDRLRTFGKHIFYVAGKAERTATALSRLLPNVGGPPASKRKVMALAVTSTLLYAAPVWLGGLRVDRYRHRIEGVQRKMALRVASAYRTVSLEASLVISGSIPLHILAEERKRIFEDNGDPKIVRERERIRSYVMWQEEFENGTKGRWTHRLIRDVRSWSTRKFGEINYHTSQFLSGHGNFGTYLNKIGKRASDACQYCGAVDTPEHAIFYCPREEVQRSETCRYVGTEISADNVVPLGLQKKENWGKIFKFVETCMARREKDFRRTQEDIPNP